MKINLRRLFGPILVAIFLIPVMVTLAPTTHVIQSADAATATSANPFWQGKTVIMLVGSAASGGYDAYARHVARHLPKYLPGKPIAVVNNMPEGKGMGMVNHLYRAKPDGLTIAIINRDLPVQQLVGFPGIKFDMSKMSWLGCTTIGETIFYARADKGWNSLADMKKANRTINVAASGMGSSPYQFLRAIELAFDLKFNIVHYPGTGDRMMAIERGEVDAGTLDTDPFMATYKHLLDRGVVKILLQTGPERNQLFPNVPSVPELLQQLPTNPTGASLMRVFLNTTLLGRPFAGPPGIPKDRLDILTNAFEKTLEDPTFLAEAKQLQITIKPISGEKIQGLVNNILRQPPEVVSLFKEMFKEK